MEQDYLTERPLFERIARISLVPMLVANLYSIYGVLFLDWSIADLFFWFWCEFLLAGLAMLVLTMRWLSTEKNLQPGLAATLRFSTIFSFVLILFYASLFTGVAYMGEWKSWGRFPEFLIGKKLGLTALATAFVWYVATLAIRREARLADADEVEMMFGRKSVVILGLYAVLMFYYHFTGARRLDLTPAYLKMMGLVLLGFKLASEAGCFDRFVRRRAKAPVRPVAPHQPR